MIIDLSEWNEYVADDVPPRSIPCGVRIETMQIVTTRSFREFPIDDYPTGIQADLESIKIRFFWRIPK